MVVSALLLTQCRKPSIEFPTAEQAVTVSMTITAGPGSKTDISTTGGVTWSSGDVIYVGYDGKNVGSLTLTEVSTATASEITTTEDLATYGAVFLPASGYRKGTNVSGFGSYGDYWSSVATSSPMFALMLYFDQSHNPETTLYARATGSSVRLVRSAS